jgi:hypothetical protein
MEKKNRSVVLDGEGVHLLEHDIAHTRGRAILRPENQTHSDQVLFCGKDTSQNDIKSAVLTGMEIGKELFARYTCFRDLEDVDDDESGDFGNWTEETSEEVTDDESDNEDFGIDLEEFVSTNYVHDKTEVVIDGTIYNIQSVVQKYCNGGRKKIPSHSQSRHARFQTVSASKDFFFLLPAPRLPLGCIVLRLTRWVVVMGYYDQS